MRTKIAAAALIVALAIVHSLPPAIAELVANAAMPCYVKVGCAALDGDCRKELLERISKR